MRSKQEAESKPTPKSKFIINFGQVLSGIFVGAVLGIAGTFYVQGTDITSLKQQIAQMKIGSNSDITKATSDPSMSAKLPKPEKLLDIIKEQQHDNVRESDGESADRCFTDENLKQFIGDKVPARITEQLRHNNGFIDIVLTIKAMQPTDRQKLLEAAINTARPTWAQLRKISPEGQTEAGHKAEMMIATSVVNLVRELSNRPVEEIKKLYV